MNPFSITYYFLKKTLLLLLMLVTHVSVSAISLLRLQLSSTNPLYHAPVVIKLNPQQHISSAYVKIEGEEVPCQLDDLDGNGQMDELSFLVDMNKNDRKTAIITLSTEGSPHFYPAKTYAEMVLRNPNIKEKNLHDIYISAITIDKSTRNPYNVLHHHGVVFENELIAARIYMDHRQTIDLYGKYHQRLELHDTQFYTSKEQKAKGYGDDVLWVGNSFGLGALRGWDGTHPEMLNDVNQRTQRIITQGPVRTIVEMEDKGWTIRPGQKPVNLVVRYTLYAGRRDIQVDAVINQFDYFSQIQEPSPTNAKPFNTHSVTKSNSMPFHLSTGIVNVKGSQEFSDHHGLRGCWGTDWPAADTVNWKRETVGLGIYVPPNHLVKEVPADKENYTFVVTPVNGQLHYDITYTSDNEDFGFHSSKAWFDFLKNWKLQLEHPLKIKWD